MLHSCLTKVFREQESNPGPEPKLLTARLPNEPSNKELSLTCMPLSLRCCLESNFWTKISWQSKILFFLRQRCYSDNACKLEICGAKTLVGHSIPAQLIHWLSTFICIWLHSTDVAYCFWLTSPRFNSWYPQNFLLNFFMSQWFIDSAA